MNNLETDIVVIGAGAAGMMCAYIAAQKGKKVVLLDHNKQVGKKILISGGGRCNFTNMHSEPNDFYSNNPHFCKSALSRFTPWDFIEMVEKKGIKYFEKKLGQLFCKDSAKEINEMLLGLMKSLDVTLLLEKKDLNVEKCNEAFIVSNPQLSIVTKDLVIATGGLSVAPIGATDFGHKVAKSYGHKIIPTVPALVPYKVEGYQDLRGISLEAKITCKDKYSIEEDVLFTHKGLSGPAVLKASLHWNAGEEIEVNWLPKTNFSEIERTHMGKHQVDKALKKYLPSKFVENIFDELILDNKMNFADLSNEIKQKLIERIYSHKIKPSGTEGFRKAEATRGGVDTNEISSKTMESRLCPHLYFIGEVLDVTGQLGGHNFQWAWASANAAGIALQ